MAERLPVKQEVVGSIPTWPARKKNERKVIITGTLMELEKLKYLWTRPAALLSLMVIAILGICILYLYFFDMEFTIKLFGTNEDRVPFTKIFFLVIGGFFTLFGIFMSIEHYRNGITYVQKGKVYLDELDQFVQYDNGLLVVLNHWARLLTYSHNKILKRGYVRLINQYDHNKKLKNWIILIN